MNNRPDWKALLTASSSDVRRLSYIDRFSSIPVMMRENVAENMYYVALYSLMVHRELRGPKKLDGKILSHAITHDLIEATVGDLVRTFKYSSEEFRKAVDLAESTVIKKIDSRIRNLINESALFLDSGSGEAWYVKSIVKVADFMSVYQYIWRERMKGNKEIEPFFRRMQIDMESMRDKTIYQTKPITPFDEYMKPISDLYFLMSTDNFEQNFVTK